MITSNELLMNTSLLRQYVQLTVADILGESSQGFFRCKCFAVYLMLANGDGELSTTAKEILSEYEWSDCPEPRCPECTAELYRSIQDWMLPIVTGELTSVKDDGIQTI